MTVEALQTPSPHPTPAEEHATHAAQQASAEFRQPAAEAPREGDAAPAPEAEPAQAASRIDQATLIIRRNVAWSLAAGLVPVPLIDFLAIEAVQVKLLNELSELYGLDFREDFAKKVIGSLLSSVWSVGAGAALGFALAKLVPVVGTALGLATTPLFAGASTRALGHAFMMHFESGGTVLDFDPDKMRSYFMAELERSKKVVADVEREERASRP